MSAETMRTFAELGPYLTILVGAALPTHIWRWLGVLFAGKLDEQSELFTWVKAVATALVAGVIAKLILFPTGPLATLDVTIRALAAAAGFGAYVASGRRLALGVLVGELVILGGWLMLR
ncbi:AzlD domain-containing protein [Acuticoccus sp. M5D2P5]|uniref:AzlD domain-containing protein n=1 Tax=Acuticoccus kalidii TaxID=2910977 RepID=UPI001F325E73|nr:AzlD domain-containing protein [Acuticoccus kalidii]MCF3935755.1 AzlD domain-containing protein [Acuticoccus kalidii]